MLEPAHGIEFTDDQAEGAFPNGSRVRKVLGEPEDVMAVGALGTVLGSLGPFDPPPLGSPYAYFVQWDGWGVCIFFVRSAKLALWRPD